MITLIIFTVVCFTYGSWSNRTAHNYFECRIVLDNPNSYTADRLAAKEHMPSRAALRVAAPVIILHLIIACVLNRRTA